MPVTRGATLWLCRPPAAVTSPLRFDTVHACRSGAPHLPPSQARWSHLWKLFDAFSTYAGNCDTRGWLTLSSTLPSAPSRLVCTRSFKSWTI